jgi:ABC-type thiamine transport system substrate-binding protein
MHLLCKAVGKDLALLLLINFLMLINEELVWYCCYFQSLHDLTQYNDNAAVVVTKPAKLLDGSLIMLWLISCIYYAGIWEHSYQNLHKYMCLTIIYILLY